MADNDNVKSGNGSEQRLGSVMIWVRLLLPLCIAALGWYIGQTVGNLSSRLDNIEKFDAQLREEFVQHKSQSESFMAELERRLTRDELTIDDLVRMSRFLSTNDAQDKRIERLEDRLDQHQKEK